MISIRCPSCGAGGWCVKHDQHGPVYLGRTHVRRITLRHKIVRVLRQGMVT